MSNLKEFCIANDITGIVSGNKLTGYSLYAEDRYFAFIQVPEGISGNEADTIAWFKAHKLDNAILQDRNGSKFVVLTPARKVTSIVGLLDDEAEVSIPKASSKAKA